MLIPLTQNKFAEVDTVDYEMVSAYKWYADQHRNGRWYAARDVKIRGKRKKIYMHKFIIGSVGKKDIDHRNRDGLNNRRSNLRVCTRSQNNQNRIPSSNTSSKYKGVYWSKVARKWMAYIKTEGKRLHLGYHKKEEDAAGFYNMAARLFFGEHARVNQFKEIEDEPLTRP